MAQGPFGFQNIDFTAGGGPTLVHIGFCKVNNMAVYNHSNTLIVVQLFDLGRLPIIGTDKPTWQFPVPYATTADAATNQFCSDFHAGLKCVNGLAYYIATAISGNTIATGAAGTMDWELRP
jgi:hypothetical protein